MRRIYLFVLVLPLLSTKCIKDDKNCTQAICTEMFASVNVNVLDKNGNSATLQDYYTINTITGDTMRHDNNGWPQGSYTVVDDSYVKKMYNSKLQFRFVGIVNNAMVVDEMYTIAADCCHVSKETGKDTITLN